MKNIAITLLIGVMILTAAYNVGDTVNSSDNISWSITGPSGHPEVGYASNIFTEVQNGKPVVIFFGKSG